MLQKVSVGPSNNFRIRSTKLAAREKGVFRLCIIAFRGSAHISVRTVGELHVPKEKVVKGPRHSVKLMHAVAGGLNQAVHVDTLRAGVPAKAAVGAGVNKPYCRRGVELRGAGSSCSHNLVPEAKRPLAKVVRQVAVESAGIALTFHAAFCLFNSLFLCIYFTAGSHRLSCNEGSLVDGNFRSRVNRVFQHTGHGIVIYCGGDPEAVRQGMNRIRSRSFTSQENSSFTKDHAWPPVFFRVVNAEDVAPGTGSHIYGIVGSLKASGSVH